MDFYNIKQKTFFGQTQIIVYSSPVVTGLTSPNKGKKINPTDWSKMTMNQIVSRVRLNFKRSSRRSKNTVYDIARSNVWDWFVTLTFDPNKVDSFNYDECTKKLSKWLNNCRRSCGDNFKYIVVPELHKSGRYHFHGLFSSADALKMTDSGLKSGEDIIYNIGKYKLGFTTATRVKDTTKVSMYLAKYITKDMTASAKGKRRYWASKNCDRPVLSHFLVDKSVHADIHFNMVNNDNFVFAQEKEKQTQDGSVGYIRYYEMEGVV